MWILDVTFKIIKLMFDGIMFVINFIIKFLTKWDEKKMERLEQEAINASKEERIINGHKYYFTEKELEHAKEHNIELKEITVEDINSDMFKQNFAFYLNTGLCSQKTLDKWNKKYGKKFK